MNLFDALLLAVNSAFAGSYLSLRSNPFMTAAGCFSAFVVAVMMIGRFA